MKELILQNDEATNKLGKDIANEIKLMKTSSIEIHLEGDLGAGKTFLSRSIIKSCGWKDLVKSPTYTLCEEYDLGEYLFLHIDLYRTNGAAGLIDSSSVDNAIFGTSKFFKEKQEEKKEDIYSNIDEMLNSTLDEEEKDS